MQTLLLVSALVASYIFVGGYLGRTMYETRRKQCRVCRCDSRNCYTDHASAGFFFGLFWPVAALAASGMLLSPVARATRRDQNVESRRAEELEEQKHQNELARLRRIENEELDRTLRKRKDS